MLKQMVYTAIAGFKRAESREAHSSYLRDKETTARDKSSTLCVDNVANKATVLCHL
jgi:hypothetical protein